MADKSFAASWFSVGRDPKRLPLIGRERAERIGRPDIAEEPLVCPEWISPAIAFVGEADGEDAPKPLLLDVVHSTDTRSRSGHKFNQAGLDLSAYQDYPIILLGHGKSSGFMGPAPADPTEDIIGKSLTMRQTKHATKGTIELFPDERGQRLHELVGFIGGIGMSIGARIKQFEEVHEGDRFVGWDVLEAELLESSIVTIPANPDGKGAARLQGLLMDDLKMLCRPDAALEASPAETEGGHDDPGILHQATEQLKAASILLDLKRVGAMLNKD